MRDEHGVPGHVFLSYVRDDVEAVDRLQRVLEAAGVRVWRDTGSLWPGQDWRAEIRRAITADALVFIACFSCNSVARDKSYQNEELTLAIEQLRQRRPDDSWLIPVRLDDCVIPDRDIGGGRTLASIQRADLFGDHDREGVARLVAAVLRILGRGAHPHGHDDGTAEIAQKSRDAVRTDRTQVARILTDAETAIQAMPIKDALVLAEVAEAFAGIDPDRAERLVADAERAAQSMTGGSLEGSAHHLAGIAGALGAIAPDRAERLIADAERAAEAITGDKFAKASALADVARALAAIDPARAERVAQSITDEHRKLWGLHPLAAIDPDRAERVAQSINNRFAKALALADIARALAATDPDRAERVAQSITGNEQAKASALASVAGALTAIDPDRAARLIAEAERVAQSVITESGKAEALADVARALATIDPDRAIRLIADAERAAQAITADGSTKASALGAVARTLAAIDPDRAERVAQSITDKSSKEYQLVRVAEALAAVDPDRAERLAKSITSQTWRASALAKIAKAWKQG